MEVHGLDDILYIRDQMRSIDFIATFYSWEILFRLEHLKLSDSTFRVLYYALTNFLSAARGRAHQRKKPKYTLHCRFFIQF